MEWHLDSNQGPTDYESRERHSLFSTNSKNSGESNFPELPNPTETDSYPNRITIWLSTEPAKLKIAKRFLATEIRSKTDPFREIRERKVYEVFYVARRNLKIDASSRFLSFRRSLCSFEN